MEDGNSVVEFQHDQAQSRAAQAVIPYLGRALEDCVDRVLRGERVPKSGLPSIDVLDFLDQHVSVNEQTEWLTRLITSPEPQYVVSEFRSLIEKRLREHLEGSEIVLGLADDMALEAQGDRA